MDDEWMNEWQMNKWMNEWMNEYAHVWNRQDSTAGTVMIYILQSTVSPIGDFWSYMECNDSILNYDMYLSWTVIYTSWSVTCEHVLGWWVNCLTHCLDRYYLMEEKVKPAQRRGYGGGGRRGGRTDARFGAKRPLNHHIHPVIFLHPP